MSWRTAVDVAQELDRDTGSHLFASRMGYKWVASHTDIGIAIIANEMRRAHAIPYPMPAENEISDSDRQDVEEYYAEHSAWN